MYPLNSILCVPHRSNEGACEEELESEEELDECGIFFALNNIANGLQFLDAFFSTHRHNVALFLFDGFERHMCDGNSHS